MADASQSGLTLNQIALVGKLDTAVVVDWYCRMFGFLPAGSATFGGPDIAEVQGLDVPTVQIELAWLVDQNEFFQLEIFRYIEPESKPIPLDGSAIDIGYRLVSMHVTDLDATLQRLAGEGVQPLKPVSGKSGKRRARVRDPSNNVLELMERDIRLPDAPPRLRPDVPVTVRSISAVVPDLDRARQFYVDTLRMTPVDIELHDAEDEALWGRPEMPRRTLVLASGDLFLELIEYTGSKATWRDDYRLNDCGVMNIAIGARSAEPYRKARQRVLDDGHAAHRELLVPPYVEVCYALSADGFSVEMMYMDKKADADFGFAPKT